MEFSKWLNNLLEDKKINICILGDTTNQEKFAYQIKQAFLDKQYKNIYCVDKEIKSMDDVPNDIDLLILCMHPVKAFNILTNAHNNIKNVLIQPGASSPEIIDYLSNKKITYYDGCILKHWNLIKH